MVDCARSGEDEEQKCSCLKCLGREMARCR
jgi:hypothetical protein